MLSAIAHLGAVLLAIGITVALVQTAFAVPSWWVSLTMAALMTIPVGLLSWAGAPSWLIPVPLVAILGLLAYTLSALAVEQYRRLQHLRNERDFARTGPARRVVAAVAPAAPAAAPAGWWDAPLALPLGADDCAAAGDGDSAGDRRSDDSGTDDRREFDELMRRNFTA